VLLISNQPSTPTTRVIRVALDGAAFDYRAGQAASVAVDAVPATPYSIASAPFETDEQRYLEFLVKVDGSTRFGAQVANLPPGTPLTVGAPTGGFGLPPDAPEHHLLFVAGGTGIAPVRSMLLQAIHIDKRHRPTLIYSARTPDEFAYVNELHALQDAGKLTLVLTLTGDSAGWKHARGRAGREHLAGLIEPDTLCFVCGPPAMVADIPTACESLGVTPDRIRTERW
jgi:ferredoxin-NADP reductase